MNHPLPEYPTWTNFVRVAYMHKPPFNICHHNHFETYTLASLMCCGNLTVFQEIIEASRYNNYMLLPSETPGCVRIVHSGCLDDLLQPTSTTIVCTGQQFISPYMSFNAMDVINAIYRNFDDGGALVVPTMNTFLQCNSADEFINAFGSVAISDMLQGHSNMPNMWFLHPWWFVHASINPEIPAATLGFHIITVLHQHATGPELLCCPIPSLAIQDAYGLLVFLWLVSQDFTTPVPLQSTDIDEDIAHSLTAHLYVAITSQMSMTRASQILNGPLQFQNVNAS